MKTELIDISPTLKEIKIEIASETVRAAFDRISDTYARQINVPGFRKGHAPRSVVRSRFKNEIRGDVIRELVPDAVNKAINELKLPAVGEPDVNLDESAQVGDGPLAFNVKIEVLPEVELKKYKGLEVTRHTRAVQESDLDVVLEQLRESSASLQPVEDRGAQMGDIVTVNFAGNYVDDPEAEPIKVEDVEVIIGGPKVQQEFTDNLTGVRADETRSFVVEYPADFSSPGLAGKKVSYEATVTAVKMKELPEMDDEWASSLGDSIDSLATLRTKVREDLEQRTAQESDHRVRADVVKKLVEENQFEVPQTLINHQANYRLQTLMRDLVDRGIDPRQSQLNWEGAREQMLEQAEEDVRATLLMERIAEVEKIEATDDDLEAEYEAIAQGSNKTKEEVRALLTKDGGDRSIANSLRNRKVIDLLLENASVTEEQLEAEEREAKAESASGHQPE